MNAHTIFCSRSAITNRVCASVWAFTHTLANVDLAVETLFSISPVYHLLEIEGLFTIYSMMATRLDFRQGGRWDSQNRQF